MKEELLKKLKEAMRNKDTVLKNTITMIRSAVLQIEKDEKRVLEDDEIKIVVSKEVKKRKEAKKEFEKADRLDLVEQLDKEIDILSEYMPKQLTNDELENIIKDAIVKVNAESIKDMGKVMKEIMPKVNGVADGNTISSKVKELLK